MSSSILDEVLREVKAIREKVEKMEDIVEERLIGVEEPSEDEVRAIKGYLKAKEKGTLQLCPMWCIRALSLRILFGLIPRLQSGFSAGRSGTILIWA